VGAVQLAGLLRDVGGREKHAVEQLHRGRRGFRDDLAVAFILKAVDQNAVVACQRLDLAYANFIQCGEGLGPLQALQHAAQVAHLVHGAVDLRSVGLEFQLQHQNALVAVQQAFVFTPQQRQGQRRCISQGGVDRGLLHCVGGLGAAQRGQRQA